MSQMELGGAALVEYEVGGVAWRCGRFDLLGAEFAVEAAQLARFHAVASGGGKERGWLIVRRLFGMQPVLPSMTADPEDLRSWTRGELQERLGLTRAQLQAELDAVRGAWGAAMPKAEAPAAAAKKAFRGELHFAEEGLLEQHGFNLQFKTTAQRSWFAGRVRDFEKLLREKATQGLARTTLMTELQLRQLDEHMADPSRNSVGSGEWRTNMKARQDLDKAYNEQLKLIDKLAPWFGAIAGKYAFTGVLSDVTRGIQEYQARGDRQLIDGMMTAMEMRIECRRSVQAGPRYRADLAVYVGAAREGLWDPNWKSPFEPRQLKRVRAAWQAALVEAGVADGEPVPDLEKEGPEGEYAPLTPVEPPKMEDGK